MKPVGFGIAGMGGYAASIADRLLADAALPDAKLKVIAACDPKPASLPKRVHVLKGAGVEIHDSFDALLNHPDIEVIWLPLPIKLHRVFTERALAAGKHVVVEKPAAGTVDEVDAMIAARERSGLLCCVGFQDVYQPAVVELKQRILSGQLGRVKRVSIAACWPRPLSYYNRNDWAGKMKDGDSWVLDSPVNNAMAHSVHVALSVLGEENRGATIETVEAELYRANDIENYDTATIRATVSGPACDNCLLTIAMTHACSTVVDPSIVFETERGPVIFQHNIAVVYGTGADEQKSAFLHGHPWPLSDAVARRVFGDTSAPIGTLEMARAHTQLINVVSQASPVHTIAQRRVKSGAEPIVVVDGIEDALRQCASRGQLLHETGLMPWSRPGEKTDATKYAHFAGPAA